MPSLASPFRLMNDKSGRIRDESSVHALKIKEVDTRIESEIAGLRSLIATVSGTSTASYDLSH